MKILKLLIILILIVSALQVSAEAQKKDYSANKEEAQDLFISRCVEESAGNETDEIIKKDALAKCKFRKLKTDAISIQANQLKLAARNEFIELQKGKMLIAIDSCKTVNCKDIFKKRIEKLNKLQQKYQDRLKTIEETKLDKIKEFNDLKSKPYFVKYGHSEEFKARAIDPIKLDISRKGFIKAEQNVISMKERARITKQQFDKTKIEVLNCTINSTEVKTAECDEIRETLNTKAKEHLINTVDRILEQLKKLISKIESNDDLTEEEASEISIAIDEQIKIVDNEKIKIENSKNKKEIIESAKRLKGVWARIKQTTSLQTQRTVNARIGGIIIQLKQLGIKLERVLARITEDNVDVSKIQPLVEKFDKNIEEARINYEMAQDKFIAAKSQQLPDAVMIKEAQGYMETAHDDIQESQENLKEIVLAIKNVGGVKSLESRSEEGIEEQLEGQG